MDGKRRVAIETFKLPESTGGLPMIPAERGTNGLFNESIVPRSVACDKAMPLLGLRVETPVE